MICISDSFCGLLENHVSLLSHQKWWLILPSALTKKVLRNVAWSVAAVRGQIHSMTGHHLNGDLKKQTSTSCFHCTWICASCSEGRQLFLFWAAWRNVQTSLCRLFLNAVRTITAYKVNVAKSMVRDCSCSSSSSRHKTKRNYAMATDQPDSMCFDRHATRTKPVAWVCLNVLFCS